MILLLRDGLDGAAHMVAVTMRTAVNVQNDAIFPLGFAGFLAPA